MRNEIAGIYEKYTTNISNAVLARHAEEAQLKKETYIYYNLAVQESIYLGDPVTFTDYQNKILELLPETDLSDEQKIEHKLSIEEQIGKANYEFNPQIAIDYLSNSILHEEKQNNLVKVIDLTGYLARSCELIGDYEGVIECCDKALSLIDKVKYPIEIILLNYYKLESTFNLGRFEETIVNATNEVLPSLDKYITKNKTISGISISDLKNIEYETKSKLETAKLTDNPETVALRFREKFSLTEEKQRKFKTSYELFNYLRDILEEMNIYLFQFSMPVEDARGFVFVDESPNVVVVNTKDNIEARIFSLMHEFAHILLGESVIDLPDATYIYKDKVEKWCNEFSSTFLLPKNLAKSAFDTNKENLTKKETLKYLSNKYKVSKAMLILNMLKLKYIEKNDYDAILARFKKEEIKPKKEGEKATGGGIPSEVRCLSEVGNKFVSLVANNYDKEYITYSDALNYLSIKSRNFDKVLSKAKK